MKCPSNLIDYYSSLLSYSIILEASAYPKPGNTHRLSDYRDKPYLAFLYNSLVFERIFYNAISRACRGLSVSLGSIIYEGVSRMMEYSGKNTSLGQILLLSPMSISIGKCMNKGYTSVDCIVGEYGSVVEETSIDDTILFYKSLRLVKPSYLRETDNTMEYVNIWDPDYENKLRSKGHRLIDVLRYSSAYDIVADEVVKALPRSRKYSKFLREKLDETKDWNKAVVLTFIEILSSELDSLVVRKHGLEAAYRLYEKAGEIKKMVYSSDWLKHLLEFDSSLKQNNINPGSSADILTSTIALYLLEEGVKTTF
ncbi:triphosphoribosyl-dephospho-CoA synthase [Thermogladius sp. 4427co]|uniref:triphosphoribosyl-dephospho-CoA synthase n=1 Tax=Thermogladius sp. 4427co TaxID=3450718 RepID=UPI003F7A8619